MNMFRRNDLGQSLAGVTIAIMLLLGLMAPGMVLADGGEPLTGTAVIANADGQNVKLRESPSREAAEIARFAEGTEVEIVDGPVAGDEATWYEVAVDDEVGFMDADFLEAAPTSPTATPTSTPGTPTGSVSGRATVSENLHVRSGPSTADAIVVTLAAGAVVTLTGGERNGFVSVSAAGGDGWVAREFLVPVGATPTPTTPTATPTPTTPTATTPPTVTATATPTESPGQTGTRYTQVVTNLRSGASADASVIVLMDVGVPVQLQGAEENGFAQVTTVFGDGWVAVADIGQSSPGTTPTSTATPVTPAATATPVTPTVTPVTPGVTPTITPTTTPSETVSRWTTENVNLRTAADTGSASLGVIAAGTEVQFTGQTSNGLSQVQTDLGTGWISSEFLAETEPAVTPTPDPTEEPGGSLLSWPVQGGEWRVLQGYNGSSHQNRSSTWQYLYSLDLVRSNGSTAGQPVYAPADGTVRWIDEAFGGGSIYLGDGLAFAWFHTIVDPALVEGGRVTKGQQIGILAPAGVAGAGSTPHLHIAIWETMMRAIGAAVPFRSPEGWHLVVESSHRTALPTSGRAPSSCHRRAYQPGTRRTMEADD
jgi:uncharacterized protein YgiM (DUF1202 family)